MANFSKKLLRELYLDKEFSSSKIAKKYNCSESKINYWLKKYNIKKRTISDAIYKWNNPKGDPFAYTNIEKDRKSFIYGLGLGLYWGEGTKRNEYSVRLGNTDPDIIVHFIKFLEEIYNINKKNLRFGIQIFSTMNKEEVINFWIKKLNIPYSQFYKTIITRARGNGTYKHKIQHGVLTLYFNNKKLRDLLNKEIENLRNL